MVDGDTDADAEGEDATGGGTARASDDEAVGAGEAAVTWRLFADIAEAAGAREVTVCLSRDATARDALAALVDAHPALADAALARRNPPRLAGHVSLLVNGEQARPGDEVAPGDELALLPPASGG